MTFAEFVTMVGASVGVTAFVTWAIVSEHYLRRIAERDAVLLGHRCGLLDAELRRRQGADRAELDELRESLRRTGPDWARGYRHVMADEMARELEQAAELRGRLEQQLEAVSFELVRLQTHNEELSRVRPTGSDHPD